MLSLLASVALVSAASLPLALPLARDTHAEGFSLDRGCDISSAVLEVPEGITPPSGVAKYLTVGVGTQNYTCSDAGNYTSIGAVAEIFDLSCLYSTAGVYAVDYLNNPISDIWNSINSTDPRVLLDFEPAAALHLGEHFFIPNGQAISPKWDFTASGSGTVTGKLNQTVPSADPKQDINTLHLTNAAGDLASEIYRVNNKGGVQPASCTPGTDGDIVVKYVSNYWFFQGTTTTTTDLKHAVSHRPHRQ